MDKTPYAVTYWVQDRMIAAEGPITGFDAALAYVSRRRHLLHAGTRLQALQPARLAPEESDGAA